MGLPSVDFSAIDAVVFDLDGVVWLGNTPVGGAAESIEALRKLGKEIRFLTNNASLHRSKYRAKFDSMSIAASPEEIISSGYAAAQYLKNTVGSAAVHIMGTEGLMQEMLEAGHQMVERNASAVVVGYDRQFSWEKLDLAFQNIWVDKAQFIACNLDRRYVEADSFRPGTGATVAALAYALERQPDVVIGKPNRPILDALFKGLDCDPKRAVLVGDKLYTDIAAGAASGMRTILVRTGHGKEEEKLIGETKPDLVLDSIVNVPDLFR